MLYADPLLLATGGIIPLSSDAQLSEPLAIATIGHISLIAIQISQSQSVCIVLSKRTLINVEIVHSTC
jgi:hypothetical protein